MNKLEEFDERACLSMIKPSIKGLIKPSVETDISVSADAFELCHNTWSSAQTWISCSRSRIRESVTFSEVESLELSEKVLEIGSIYK